ncbi:Hydrogen peroxide-inducible genes activator [Anatilimnocola aggregata]|uniref:Hydrogen peroxide-inducible genes activator n=1 Tax=Anatilimnocola aggregata TaxID=2528021 RepID=A0A517YKJ1_9BACT|nr:LysR family transcriptional regulator [Anatilimnocola aggregata]QDU30730.1 Hydrogen peroxide-inducible genes activator [Anatilimnocola aggregata]
MEITQLRYFLKLAERGNFTRAAEDLLITQPALSRSIAKLEAELGQPVFERHARTVELTDSGKLLLARAEQILTLVDDTVAEITDDGRTGRIRLGTIPTIAPYLLPPLLRGFATKCPQSNVIVYEEVTEKLLQRVLHGEIDLAILALPVPKQYLHVETLFEEELRLVLPVDHPLSKKKQIVLDDLQPYSFVLLDETHCLSNDIVSFCRQRSLQPVSVERTSQLATVQELVSLGHGVSLVPAMACNLDDSPRRIYRHLAGTQPTRTVALVSNPYRFESRLVKLFRDFVKSFRYTMRK